MKKLAILFFLVTTPVYSQPSEEFKKLTNYEALVLWEGSKPISGNAVNIYHCNDFAQGEETENLEEQTENNVHPPFCDNIDTVIPEQEWNRPFVHAFENLLKYYDPFYPASVGENEEDLVNKFLKEFVETETATRLYFSIHGNWDSYDRTPPGQANTEESITDTRTDDEKAEDIVDNSCNRKLLIKHMKILIDFLDRNPDAEVGEEQKWWDNIEGQFQKNFKEIGKLYEDPEEIQYFEHDKLTRPLVAKQRRKLSARLKQMWFGDTSKGWNRRIGFRRVFVGERNKRNRRTLGGLYNWYQFYRLACKVDENKPHTVSYEVTSYDEENTNQQIPIALKYCTVLMKWKIDETNELSSSPQHSQYILFGSTPDYDFALYTLCFYKQAVITTSNAFASSCDDGVKEGDFELKSIYAKGIFNDDGDSHIIVVSYKKN